MSFLGDLKTIYRNKYIPITYHSDEYGDCDINNASIWLSDAIKSDRPVMVSRFGSTEMDCYINYRKGSHPFYWLRKLFPFWVCDSTKKNMMILSGYFPNDNRSLSMFSDLIDDCINEIDILASWLNSEELVNLPNTCKRITLLNLEPYWSDTPWTYSLKGKKVLVIHPFANTILRQYKKRELLFQDNKVLPEFDSLTVIPSIQSIGGETHGFKTWFDALRYMESEIDHCDYDVALIGCGAYGMPLAAHCKSMGKKAVHMGGALQLLFGIKGSRWEDPNYNNEHQYTNLFNEYWVRPSEEEKPKAADNVEKACYW